MHAEATFLQTVASTGVPGLVTADCMLGLTAFCTLERTLVITEPFGKGGAGNSCVVPLGDLSHCSLHYLLSISALLSSGF